MWTEPSAFRLRLPPLPAITVRKSFPGNFPLTSDATGSAGDQAPTARFSPKEPFSTLPPNPSPPQRQVIDVGSDGVIAATRARIVRSVGRTKVEPLVAWSI